MFDVGAAPKARCCVGQGLPPIASGRLMDQYLLETHRASRFAGRAQAAPQSYGTPLRRRSGAAVLARMRLIIGPQCLEFSRLGARCHCRGTAAGAGGGSSKTQRRHDGHRSDYLATLRERARCSR